MASALGLRRVTRQRCRTRQHHACAVQALCGVAGCADRESPGGGPLVRPSRGGVALALPAYEGLGFPKNGRLGTTQCPLLRVERQWVKRH